MNRAYVLGILINMSKTKLIFFNNEFKFYSVLDILDVDNNQIFKILVFDKKIQKMKEKMYQYIFFEGEIIFLKFLNGFFLI